MKIIKPSKREKEAYFKHYGLNLKEIRISSDKDWERYAESFLTSLKNTRK